MKALKKEAKMPTSSQLEKLRKKTKKLNRIKPDRNLTIKLKKGQLDEIADIIGISREVNTQNMTQSSKKTNTKSIIDFAKKIKTVTKKLPELQKTPWTVSFVDQPVKNSRIAVAIVPIQPEETDEDMRLFAGLRVVPNRNRVIISFELSIDTSFNGQDWEILEYTQFQINIEDIKEAEALNAIDKFAFKGKSRIAMDLIKADPEYDLSLMEGCKKNKKEDEMEIDEY